MADRENEEAARALERLSAPQTSGPTPQPKPRAAAASSAAKPARPAAPRPSAPVARPDAPARPRAAEAQDLQHALAAAAANPSASGTARAKPPGANARTALAFRRTVIPILLTLGFILVALALTHYAWKSDDNPVIELSTPIVLAMLATGLLAWLLAAANMLSVRRALRDASPPSPDGNAS